MTLQCGKSQLQFILNIHMKVFYFYISSFLSDQHRYVLTTVCDAFHN